MYVHNNPKKIEVGNLRNMVKKKKKLYHPRNTFLSFLEGCYMINDNLSNYGERSCREGLRYLCQSPYVLEILRYM